VFYVILSKRPLLFFLNATPDGSSTSPLNEKVNLISPSNHYSLTSRNRDSPPLPPCRVRLSSPFRPAPIIFVLTPDRKGLFFPPGNIDTLMPSLCEEKRPLTGRRPFSAARVFLASRSSETPPSRGRKGVFWRHGLPPFSAEVPLFLPALSPSLTSFFCSSRRGWGVFYGDSPFPAMAFSPFYPAGLPLLKARQPESSCILTFLPHDSPSSP